MFIFLFDFNRYTPVPDTIIAKAVSSTEQTNVIDPREQKYGGFATPATGMSTPSAEIEMVKIGQARNTLMNMRLTQVRQIKLNIFKSNTRVQIVGF